MDRSLITQTRIGKAIRNKKPIGKKSAVVLDGVTLPLAGGSDAVAAGAGPLRALEPDSPASRRVKKGSHFLKVTQCFAFAILIVCGLAVLPSFGQPPPKGAPTKSRDQQPTHAQTVPKDFKTHIFVHDEQGQARAEQLIELYEVLANEPTIENVRKYVSDDYIQHSTMIPNGPQPLAMLFSQSVAKYPIKIDIHKIAVVGDFGMAHVNFRNLDNDSPEDLGTAAVDMYYWGKDGKIVEHWDTLQMVPTLSANANTPFLKLTPGDE
ncbi:MAG: nuclear transport factor 2 family protein [Planctomycetota bacterium]